MANKRYYWLKLKEDYFNSPKIKKLRKIAGGDTYTIIYLKMQLLSISNNGIIQFEKIEPTIQEELALKLDEDIENVGITLNYLQTQGLIEVNENNEFLLIEASNCIGSECESSERVRLFREREKEKMLQCNKSVTEMEQISISISNSNSLNNNKEEIKETKHKHGEFQHILLTDTEYGKLINDYGKELTLKAIVFLDEYIEMKGTKYKSHYMALKKWVFEAVERQSKTQKQSSGFTSREYKKEEIDGLFDNLDDVEI